MFEFPANDFFQNNNAILKPLTEYVKQAIFGTTSEDLDPTHLVDTYCGSGLFAICLAPFFSRVAGIEISSASIEFAKRNAKLNGYSDEKCEFRAGTAEQIFQVVNDFPAGRTAVVIDPPRKGCDAVFIEQLLSFRPSLLVYVSCNVHTQARDIGDIITQSSAHPSRPRYLLESLRGFDLFPQTAHVESVAVLRLQK